MIGFRLARTAADRQADAVELRAVHQIQLIQKERHTVLGISAGQGDKVIFAKAEFTLEEGEQEVMNVFTKIDRAGGKFSFGATVDGETYEIKGNYDKSGKKHTFDFKDVTYTDSTGEEISMIDTLLAEAEGEEIDFELKVIICENDKPKPLAKGKVKSAFELDDEDFEDVKIAVEELIEEAKNSIESASSEGEAVAPELGW